MSESKRNVPKLRFPGFTEAWEQRKLGELLKYEQPQSYIVESTEYSDHNPTPVLTAGQSFILGYTNETQGVKSADPNHPVIIFDDFTTSSHLVDFPFKIKSSAMKLLSLEDERDDFFFAFYSLKNISYTPKNHERHWISKFAAFDVSVPNNVEQARIGSFFRDLDDLITLHQRKLDHLKLQKRGLLQKMFPRDGADRPEIRFPGFTDAWEQRKLGEVASEFQSGEFIAANEIVETGAYPVYGGNGLRGYTNRYNHEGFFVLIGRQGALCGNIKSADGKAYFTEHAVVVKANSEHDTRFLVYLLGRMNLGQYSGQSAQPGLAVGVLKELDSAFPLKAEQARIGSFFRDLDDLITLHQRKLDHLKLQKKALLQQMFI